MAYFGWFVTELVFLPDTVFPCGRRKDAHEGREGQRRSPSTYKSRPNKDDFRFRPICQKL